MGSSCDNQVWGLGLGSGDLLRSLDVGTGCEDWA